MPADQESVWFSGLLALDLGSSSSHRTEDAAAQDSASYLTFALQPGGVGAGTCPAMSREVGSNTVN
jgi:hypothetical protein